MQNVFFVASGKHAKHFVSIDPKAQNFILTLLPASLKSAPRAILTTPNALRRNAANVTVGDLGPTGVLNVHVAARLAIYAGREKNPANPSEGVVKAFNFSSGNLLSAVDVGKVITGLADIKLALLASIKSLVQFAQNLRFYLMMKRMHDQAA